MKKRKIKTAPLKIEKGLWADGFTHVAGIDEAGRGCLAGPVVAAAVILGPNIRIKGVTDSKLLSADERKKLLSKIFLKAQAVSVGICSHDEIDRLNILQASLEAMRRAVESLSPSADFLLIDGNKAYPCPKQPHFTLIKGDSRSHSIACASIVAKVTRDNIMTQMAEQFPQYKFETNKGYPTNEHYNALKEYGETPIHRLTFNLLSPSLRPKSQNL